MFYLPSGCRDFPAEPVCQLDPQVIRPGTVTTMATISTHHWAADAEILTLTDGRTAPVVLEVQEVLVDREAPEGLADPEVLEGVDGLVEAEEALGLIRSTTVSSSRRKTCQR